LEETAWYHRWFGADYLQLYDHRSPEEAAKTIAWLVDEVSLPRAARVLDLACGNGRHGRELARRGFETYGLDLSWPLLRGAKIPDQGKGMKRVRGDMRHLPFKNNVFTLILSLFTSFGYFPSEEEDQKVICEVSRLLKKGGIYVLDYLNASLVRSQIAPSEETLINGQRATILRWLDEPKGRVEKRILIHESEVAFREYRESVRLYSEANIREILARANLQAGTSYGDYDGSGYRTDSPRLIIVGYKNA
jgi:SAM-dependent methyltransferase